MANGNNQRLKAFVRFDGSGRVVAGSLILRKSKPKVGKWQEINAYECCNSTTSTTTTISPLLILSFYNSGVPINACNSSFSTNVTLSTGTSIIVGQTIVYENGTPFLVNPGIPAYITFPSLGSSIYTMNENAVIFEISGDCSATTTTTSSSSTSTSTTTTTTTVLG